MSLRRKLKPQRQQDLPKKKPRHRRLLVLPRKRPMPEKLPALQKSRPKLKRPQGSLNRMKMQKPKLASPKKRLKTDCARSRPVSLLKNRLEKKQHAFKRQRRKKTQDWQRLRKKEG